MSLQVLLCVDERPAVKAVARFFRAIITRPESLPTAAGITAG